MSVQRSTDSSTHVTFTQLPRHKKSERTLAVMAREMQLIKEVPPKRRMADLALTLS